MVKDFKEGMYLKYFTNYGDTLTIIKITKIAKGKATFENILNGNEEIYSLTFLREQKFNFNFASPDEVRLARKGLR